MPAPSSDTADKQPIPCLHCRAPVASALLTARVGDWPEEFVPGNGYVVWLDPEGGCIAVCEVEVGP